MPGIARRSSGQNKPLPDGDDQDDVESLEQLRRDIELYLKRAGYGNNALKYAFAVQLDITAMLVQTKIATRQALRHAARVAHQVSRPTAAIEDQLVRSFKALAWEQRMRFSMLVGVLYATGTTIFGTIFAFALIEAHRDTPDAAALRVAAGDYSAGWTVVMEQNDLRSLVTACTKLTNIFPAPNGRHSCLVPLFMDGVEARPPTLPAWSQDTTGGAPR